MSLSVQVAGPALIRVAPGGGGQILDFGYTQDGAKIAFYGHKINVPGDETGGSEEIPIEIQLVGETAMVRLEMTKWEDTTADRLAARLPSRTAGGVITPGRLAFANSDYWRLIIASTNKPYNFPCATLHEEPIEINRGTKFSRLLMAFKCYRNPISGNGATIGLLYNHSVT